MTGLRSRGPLLAVLALGALAVLLTSAAASGAGAPKRDVSLLKESQAAVGRALLHLKSTQGEDGSWCNDPAVTALVVMAMVGSGQDEFGPASAPVSRGLDFIRSHAMPEGGIYDRVYPSYSTSVCATALFVAGKPEDEGLVRSARRFLLDLQADESEGFTPDSVDYGGWGYESSPSREETHRADLSNTQFALEALRQLEALDAKDRARSAAPEWAQTPTEVAYDRAAKFLERCQNLKQTNDQPWASDDGGFVYRSGESKAGETPEGGLRSYAGMTYAGLKSMIYARLDKADPRVKAAYEWACRHWSVTENPGLGQEGLYYYYVTMARALQVYGTEQVVDAEGVAHDWRQELVSQLLKVQRADGSWTNENGRWMEQIPDLVTAYSLLAIQYAAEGW